MKQILVLNSGSSSIKFELFDMDRCVALEVGLVERIGEEKSRVKCQSTRGEARVIEAKIPDHGVGINLMRELLAENESFADGEQLVGVGHRVVHGGELFCGPQLINQSVIESIRKLAPLAPLHNPPNLLGIEVARSAFTHVPQVAVFDTAFHQTLPRYAYHYAIPREYYERFQIRRYGFHGTSHLYVTKRVADHLGRPAAELNLIVFHLGNGASAAAIRGGESVDTSMGMTPLEGLVMGTRCGDLDPAIVFYLGTAAQMSPSEIDALLNKQSGLKGICGANDMREVLHRMNAGYELSGLAVDMFTYRIKKYLGAYHAILGRLDAVAFTAGIGENSSEIRRRSCEDLKHLGIEIDPSRNVARQQGIREIQSAESAVRVLVVPTDEELEIAQQTLLLITSLQDTPAE